MVPKVQRLHLLNHPLPGFKVNIPREYERDKNKHGRTRGWIFSISRVILAFYLKVTIQFRRIIWFPACKVYLQLEMFQEQKCEVRKCSQLPTCTSLQGMLRPRKCTVHHQPAGMLAKKKFGNALNHCLAHESYLFYIQTRYTRSGSITAHYYGDESVNLGTATTVNRQTSNQSLQTAVVSKVLIMYLLPSAT